MPHLENQCATLPTQHILFLNGGGGESNFVIHVGTKFRMLIWASGFHNNRFVGGICSKSSQ